LNYEDISNSKFESVSKNILFLKSIKISRFAKMKNVDKILYTLELSASDTREDTIKSIIRTTLLESSEPINQPTLKENIDIIFDIELYDIEFNEILKNLIDNGEILYKHEAYSLSEIEKDKLNSIDSKLKSDEVLRFNNFRDFIDRASTNKIDEKEIKLLWTTLKDYLYVSFYHYGIKAMEFLHPKYVNTEHTTVNQSEGINEAIKKLAKQELIDIFKQAVDSFPDYATTEDLDFINDIGQKTIAFASLGLSPDQAKEDLSAELIDWIIYLDTNFLFSILNLHANVENEACKELLKLVALNKEIIKIKFRYSELTLRELRHKKNDFLNLDESLTDSAINAILKSDDLDEFARKYYWELLENRSTTIHPTRIIDLAEITLPKKGVEISRNQKQIEAYGEDYINIRILEYQRFITEINSSREEFSRKNNSHLRPYFRSDTQMYHDITLREVILSSRKVFKGDEIQTFNEVKYFGLTLDELLIKFDNFKTRSSTFTIYPTFFKPSFLLNRLVKLLPIKTPDYKKAFLKAVSSRGFHKESQKSNEIIQVASYLKQSGIDNESVIFNLISEKLFMERFHQESTKPNFKSEQFLEAEINKILAEKEKEISDSKILLKKEEEKINIEKQEKEKLLIQNAKTEEDVNFLSIAVKQLKKKIKILEKSHL